ncbi:hypothetical protein B9G53_20285 [Pseudanabaena sp. SR411]|jgi:O-methyltransferase|uniref:class I SAM-dependent methyltransferase n=1 Tax=Pseudanabaena sp. SR411 TaxID=1980935 RepID=UPI000B996117|nr:class I SAM-dependent methyltransferase [Pseudanabaena sp. SR411]OYQ62773.1 hypothetical protein B9G53_20285 [Pseudanabaena sp. SR411]
MKAITQNLKSLIKIFVKTLFGQFGLIVMRKPVEAQTPETQTPEAQTPEAQTPEAQTPKPSFSSDGLTSFHDSSFMNDEAFLDAYNHTMRLIGKDYYWYWRNYIGIKLAEYSFSLSPNFVECGVGEGWMTISILRYLGKKYSDIPSFTLFDTFSGIDPSIVDPLEEESWGMSISQKKEAYKSVYNGNAEIVRNNIEATAGKNNKATIIQGSIPNTLSDDVIERIMQNDRISFLHIDMNNSIPEVASLKQFYPLMLIGGVVLLDDYGYTGHTYQKNAIDKACLEMGIPIPISLPTGQGLILKGNY